MRIRSEAFASMSHAYTVRLGSIPLYIQTCSELDFAGTAYGGEFLRRTALAEFFVISDLRRPSPLTDDADHYYTALRGDLRIPRAPAVGSVHFVSLISAGVYVTICVSCQTEVPPEQEPVSKSVIALAVEVFLRLLHR